MPKIISIEGPQGPIQFAARASGESISAVGVLDDRVVKVETSLEKVFSTARSIGDAAYAAFSASETPPKSYEVEFGLEFTARGNIYVVESKAAATIKVKLAF